LYEQSITSWVLPSIREKNLINPVLSLSFRNVGFYFGFLFHFQSRSKIQKTATRRPFHLPNPPIVALFLLDLISNLAFTTSKKTLFQNKNTATFVSRGCTFIIRRFGSSPLEKASQIRLRPRIESALFAALANWLRPSLLIWQKASELVISKISKPLKWGDANFQNKHGGPAHKTRPSESR
jgi:hypothetical protein